jgi:5-methylcytosine-specific restriction endonuclease McrA
MAKPTCSIDGCESESKTKTWCSKHYQRNRLYGAPTGTPAPAGIPINCVDCGEFINADGRGMRSMRCPGCKETRKQKLSKARYVPVVRAPSVCAWAGCEEMMPIPDGKGRPAKRCDEHRKEFRRRQQQGYTPKTKPLECAKDGCTGPRKARGLCSTHYNQTLPERHPRISVACDGCGKTCEKERRTPRYLTISCGDALCSHYLKWGSWSVLLPVVRQKRPPRAVESAPLVARDCEWCGKAFETAKPTQKYCGKACGKRRSNTSRRGREFDAIGTFTWAEVTRLWLMFDRSCAYCSTTTTLPLTQAEHVTALSRGGANNLTNLLPSCGQCNSDKRDLSLVEWDIDRKRRNLPALATSWDHGDHRYKHLVQSGSLDLAA